MSAAPARIVFLVGARRSGLSALGGGLRGLGLGAPDPAWVADLHDELLRRCDLSDDDARPDAWYATGKVANHGPLRVRVHEWLAGELARLGPEMVVEDPRSAWFVGLWRAAALRCDAEPAYALVLRPAPEVVLSQRRADGGSADAADAADDARRTAGWLNSMLHTERATRGAQRAFVRYADLLEDWTVPVHALGRALDLDAVRAAPANDIRAAAAAIDPRRRTVTADWADLRLPSRLADLAREASAQLDRLADGGGGRDAGAEAALDQVRAAYAELYGEAEAIARSSAEAEFRAGERAAGAGGAGGDVAPVQRARARIKRALGRED